MSSDHLVVTAALMPGTDDDGEFRNVLADPTIHGTVVAPSLIENHRRSYEVERTLSAELRAGGIMTVIAPDVEGLPSGSRELSLPVPARIGPDSLVMAFDDPVRLQITEHPAADWTSQWHLSAIDVQGTAHFSIQGNGYPPPEIVIPRSWFRSDAATYDVRLDIVQSHRGEFVPGRYEWAATSRAQMHWTVRFETG